MQNQALSQYLIAEKALNLVHINHMQAPKPPVKLFGRVERELLYSPICQFADENLVGIAALDLMHGAEFLPLFTCSAEFAGNRPSSYIL